MVNISAAMGSESAHTEYGEGKFSQSYKCKKCKESWLDESEVEEIWDFTLSGRFVTIKIHKGIY